MARNTIIFLITTFLMTFISADIEIDTPDRLCNKCWEGIYLKAIIWKSPREWTVYLNDEMIARKGSVVSRIQIVGVTAEAIRFKIKQGKSGKIITLKPLQSFDLLRKQVVSGDCRLGARE